MSHAFISSTAARRICPFCRAIAATGEMVEVVESFATPCPGSTTRSTIWPVGSIGVVVEEPNPRTDGFVHLDASRRPALACLCVVGGKLRKHSEVTP